MKRKNLIRNILMIALLGIAIMFFTNGIFAANMAKIIVETANLRETADEESRILVQLSLNDEVEVLQKQDNWYQVKTKNNVTGYLREDLIEVSGDVEEVETNQEEANNELATETTTEVNETSETETSATRIVKEDTKLKIVPAINATDIIDVKQNDEVIIVETIGDWICIEKETTKGWIRADKLMTVEEKEKQDEEAKAKEEAEKQASEEQQETSETTKTMYVNSTTVNVREEMSKESGIVVQISQNTAVEVISEEGGWYKVKVNGKEGYIATNLLSNEKTEVTASSRGSTVARREQNKSEENKTTAPASNSQKGATVVETAKKYIGYSYKYGASGPTSFDCSGFTTYIFKQHGISLNRTAKGQYSNGVAVSRANLQPGDLVMFGPSVSGINHVGIYIGGGKIVHAANPSRGVTTDTINSGYYNNNYVGARRVL